MGEYLTIQQAVAYASETHKCHYSQIMGKQILFEAVMDGKSLCMCTPRSKFHQAQGCYWTDITSKQADILDSYDKAFVFFRLEGMHIAGVRWADLRARMTADVMTHNSNEGDHWKLLIYSDHIKIGRNDNRVPIEIL